MLRRSTVIRTVTVCLGITFLFLSGCASSISVNYDYDTTTNFGSYRSFDWAPEPDTATTSMDATQAAKRGGLLSNRIKDAVNLELESKGLSQSPDNPDLLAVLHLGTEDKVQVTNYGYGYSNYYWGGYGGMYGSGYGGMDVYQYKQGRIIIDLVDSQTHNLVWRGTGEGVVSQTQKSPEELQAKIKSVMNQIMANYPPPLP